jgi:hypothetical protein
MKPKNDTGPANNGTFILSLPFRRALSGLRSDRRQNAAVPTNVNPMRVTCVAVSPLALLMMIRRELVKTVTATRRRRWAKLDGQKLHDAHGNLLWLASAMAGRMHYCRIVGLACYRKVKVRFQRRPCLA